MTFLRKVLNELGIEIPPHNAGQTIKGVRKHSLPANNTVINGIRHVRADAKTLLQQRGWKQTGNIWRGSYVSRYGTFAGQIERRGDTFDVLIKLPPDAVRSHPRFICFHKRQRGWWSIHLHHAPNDQDVNAILRYVEQLLAEAFQLTGKK